tara:strand:+ start:1435 stop:2520 length:1086 start_codon:yes stop_codon:yes gene_type:complete
MAGACNGHRNNITNDYYHADEVCMSGQLSKLLNEHVLNFSKGGIENSEIIHYCKTAVELYNNPNYNISKPRCAIVELRGWPDRCTIPMNSSHLRDSLNYSKYRDLVVKTLNSQIALAKETEEKLEPWTGISGSSYQSPKHSHPDSWSFRYNAEFIGTKISAMRVGNFNKYHCLTWPILQAVNNITLRLVKPDQANKQAHKRDLKSGWFDPNLDRDILLKRFLARTKPGFLQDYVKWDSFKWDWALEFVDLLYGGDLNEGMNDIKWIQWQNELELIQGLFMKHDIPVRFMSWGSKYLNLKNGKEPDINSLNLFGPLGVVQWFLRYHNEEYTKDLEYCECGHPGPVGHKILAEHIAEIISKEY